jgi:uncharacterized DUF497 family protein
MELLFEWDERKAKQNMRKHGVSFEEAKTVFNDPLLITFPDEQHSETEERLISVGTSARRQILLVIHAERREADDVCVVRLISCRRATAAERKTYEQD